MRREFDKVDELFEELQEATAPTTTTSHTTSSTVGQLDRTNRYIEMLKDCFPADGRSESVEQQQQREEQQRHTAIERLKLQSVLRVCLDCNQIDDALQFFKQAKKQQPALIDDDIYTTLIHGIVQQQTNAGDNHNHAHLKTAFQLFSELRKQKQKSSSTIPVEIYNSLMYGLVRLRADSSASGCRRVASQLRKDITAGVTSPSNYTYNLLIYLECCINDNATAAMTAYQQMKQLGYEPSPLAERLLASADAAVKSKRGRKPKTAVVTSAMESTEADASVPVRRRGRPRKVVDESLMTDSANPTGATPAIPKRRGRPPKQSTVEASLSSTEQQVLAEAKTPARRGRPQKDLANAVAEPPKKRGRPRKQQPSSIPQVAAPSTSGLESQRVHV